MIENNHAENNLEKRLRQHYQGCYVPPPNSDVIWAGVQPELGQQTRSTPRLPVLAGFLAAKRQSVSRQSQGANHLRQSISATGQAARENPRSLRAGRLFRWRLRPMFEAAIAVLVVASLLLGWLAVTRLRSVQGNGPDLYTYAGQPGEYIYDSQWTPDGQHLMFVVYTQAINHFRYMVWDTTTRKARQTLAIDLPSDLTGRIILDSADGRYALIRTTSSTGQGWVLKLANILTGQTKLMYQGTYQGQDSSTAPAAAFSDDSKYVAFIGADERVHIWNIAAGTTVRITDALGAIGTSGNQWLMWSLDGKRIVAKSVRASVARLQVWSAQTGQQLLNIGETPTMSLFIWSPEVGNLGGLSLDGKRILTYNKQTGAIVERESSTLKVLHTLSVRATFPAQDVARSEPLWIANDARFFMQIDQALYIWDASTGKLISTISLKNDPMANVSGMPAGEYIALPKTGNTVEIWNLMTGSRVRIIEPTMSLPSTYDFLAGKYLDVNDGDKNGQVYNALTGQFILNYQGDNASLSPDGKYVLIRTITDLQQIVQIFLAS